MPIEHSPESTPRPRELNRQGENPAEHPVVSSLAVLRSKRTRSRNALQAEIERLQRHSCISDVNRFEILTAKSRIDSRFDLLLRLEAQICNHDSLRTEETEREAEESEIAMEVALSAKAIIDGLIAMELSHNGAPSASSSPTTTAAGGQDSVSTNNVVCQETSSVPGSSNAANPGLFLDTTPEVFSGNTSRYRLWRSQFVNWIQRRTSATGSDRLVALSKLLKGPPKDLICELPLTDGNFDVALRLLDDNYSVPELHQRDALVNILNVPTVKSSSDTSGLRELLNVTQRTILSLEAINVPLHSISLAYEQTIRAALPISILLDFEERQQPTTSSTDASEGRSPAEAAAERLEQLLSFLRRYTVLREQVLRNSSADVVRNRSSEPNRGNHRENSNRFPPRRNNTQTVAAMAKNDGNRQVKRRKNPCFFCSGVGHLPSTCSANISIQRRREILSQRRRCQSCFRFEHTSSQQCEGPREACQLCNSKSHYTVMHEANPTAPAEHHRTAAGVVQTVAAALTVRAVVMTACAFVVDGGRRIPIRCFIDSGSMVTFATTNLIRQLPECRPQTRVELQLQGVGGEHNVTVERYSIRLMGIHDDSEPIVIQAHEFDFGVDPPGNCSEEMRQLLRRFGETHQLADISLTNREFDAAPDLLIGVDQMYKIVHLNGEKAIASGLIAKSSRLGWIVSGSFGPKTSRGDVVRVHPTCCAATISKPARDVERLWTLEAIGIADPRGEELNVADLDALRQFRDGVVYDGQRYTVTLPKRDSIVQLENNLEIARNRLAAKRRNLARDPTAFLRYDREIMAFLRDGHSEELTEVNLTTASAQDRSYYMPHRQVITQREEGDKWRIVFDCSASAPGQTSLNSHLLAGPNLNPDILRLLINFRLRSVALTADIAQAYMTLSLATDDRPYFRYLWQGPNDSSVRCFQMRKVTWGATPSGFLLAATLREHFKRVDPAAEYNLGDSFYFDDMLRSFDSVREAIEFINRLVPWLAAANMKLGKWKSSSSVISDHLRRFETSSAAPGLVGGGLLRVLGIAWAPAEDNFQFQLAKIIDSVDGLQKITKRSVLRIVASIFDPVGWLIPFTVRGKILIQSLWSRTLGWEDTVSGSLLHDFVTWAGEIRSLSALRIPRLYGDPAKGIASYRLHVFGDASERAYAAAAYLESLYDDGSGTCALVMSKSRIAPKEKITLPRLELMAALLASRLRVFVIDRLSVKIDRVFHYTDSAVAFYWCVAKDPTKWKTFVCNRVIEIQQLTSPTEWFHVPGKQNIADFATRGVAVDELISNAEWWSGPSWLADPEDSRPVTHLPNRGDREPPVVEELRLVVAPVVATSPFVNLERFSSWEKSLRVVANALSFVQRCRRQAPSSDSELRSRAEVLVIKSTQANHFAAEITATLAGERPARSSKLSSYRLHVDEQGLLRARTRLTQSPHFTFDEQNPLIIPSNCRLATLLILHHHRTNAHLGVSTVLRGCVVCRRTHGSTADQVQAPLPAERASFIAPFAVTAVDFCGPFHTRTREGTCKNYIALFTCASIRAVHLELIPDMSALQTHLALRRFLSTHPACRQFKSDSGRTFVRAAADIKRLFNSFRDPVVQEILAQHRVEWSFNCPRAPWRGGLFERLVGVTKRALTKTLGRSLITAEELRTILCELSAVINDRPLSYTDADLNEPRAITPSMMLYGGPSTSPLCGRIALDRLGPNGCVQVGPPETDQLRKRLLERTSYFRALSVRWQRDYLMQLRSANLDSSGSPRVLPDGTVCLLKEDNVPRLKWNLIRVLQGHPGRDGAIRTYSVRFANGHESRRAAQLLIPLEIPKQPHES